MQGRLATPSADVDRGWIVRIEDKGVVRFYVGTLLYLDAKPAMGPPTLTERRYPRPVHRHRTKGAVSQSSKEKGSADAVAERLTGSRHRGTFLMAFAS